jgi:hypothetical protein
LWVDSAFWRTILICETVNGFKSNIENYKYHLLIATYMMTVANKINEKLDLLPQRLCHGHSKILYFRFLMARLLLPYRYYFPCTYFPLAVCRLLGLSQEEGAMTYEDLKRSMNWDSKSHKLDARPLTSWSRLFGQLCRIPNNQILTLPAGKKGCFIIKFSHDGR